MTRHSMILLLFLAALALAPISNAVIRETVIHFDVLNGNYQDLYEELKAALSDHQPRLDVEGHLVLAPQRPNKKFPPDHRIYLRLTGEFKDETTLFICEDDLYIVGFANKSGDWHMMEDSLFFPHAQSLGFKLDYPNLIGGASKLETVPLGRGSMLHGVHAMSWHDPRVGDPDIVRSQAKLAVCRFTLMVSESLRFIPIRNSFAPGFDQESFATENDLKLLNIWGDTSELLLKWKKCNCWYTKHVHKVKERGIDGPEAALKKLDIILRKKI